MFFIVTMLYYITRFANFYVFVDSKIKRYILFNSKSSNTIDMYIKGPHARNSSSNSFRGTLIIVHVNLRLEDTNVFYREIVFELYAGHLFTILKTWVVFEVK